MRAQWPIALLKPKAEVATVARAAPQTVMGVQPVPWETAAAPMAASTAQSRTTAVRSGSNGSDGASLGDMRRSLFWVAALRGVYFQQVWRERGGVYRGRGLGRVRSCRRALQRY